MDNQEPRRDVVIVIDRRIGIVAALTLAAAFALVFGVYVGRQSAPAQPAVSGALANNQLPAEPVSQPVEQQLQVQLDNLQNDPAAPQMNAPAPDFELADVDGKTVRLSDFKGKPVLINFWATWCPPCRFEMPALEATYQKYKDKGLVILGVDSGERQRGADMPARVKSYAQQLGITFPVVLDAQDDVSGIYRLRAYPTSYFVDVNGNLTDMRRGAFVNQADIENYLKKILP